MSNSPRKAIKQLTQFWALLFKVETKHSWLVEAMCKLSWKSVIKNPFILHDHKRERHNGEYNAKT